jgi:5-methylcytosine-specific restriction endonuclease McrA
MIPKPKRFKDKKYLEKVRQLPCLICGKSSEAHHLHSRGAGGGDYKWNVVPLCRREHNAIHKMGINAFADKHPEFRFWLDAHGWNFDEDRDRWKKVITTDDELPN